MRRLLQNTLQFCEFLKSRIFAVGVLFAGLACFVFMLSQRTNAVYIRDGDMVALRFTINDEPEDILSEYGIMTMAYDSVDFTGFSGRVGEISITRAFPVLLTVDDTTNKYMRTDGSVSSLLEESGVTLGEHDTINFPLSHSLQENDHIVIQRVDYVTRTEEEVIPFEVEYQQTSLLRNGRQHVMSSGEEGLKEYVYVQRTVDGMVYEEQLEEENILKKPQTQTVLQGVSGAPVSPLDFGYTIRNGVPTHYKSVIKNATATGYTARSGARTASGQRAGVGYVAVNPEVIPYGTKMYITSSDNKFVYGYAIAADTGTGLMNGVIDVDLFYSTYYESCLNGLRTVNIYILE